MSAAPGSTARTSGVPNLRPDHHFCGIIIEQGILFGNRAGEILARRERPMSKE